MRAWLVEVPRRVLEVLARHRSARSHVRMHWRAHRHGDRHRHGHARARRSHQVESWAQLAVGAHDHRHLLHAWRHRRHRMLCLVVRWVLLLLARVRGACCRLGVGSRVLASVLSSVLVRLLRLLLGLSRACQAEVCERKLGRILQRSGWPGRRRRVCRRWRLKRCTRWQEACCVISLLRLEERRQGGIIRRLIVVEGEVVQLVFQPGVWMLWPLGQLEEVVVPGVRSARLEERRQVARGHQRCAKGIVVQGVRWQLRKTIKTTNVRNITTHQSQSHARRIISTIFHRRTTHAKPFNRSVLSDSRKHISTTARNRRKPNNPPQLQQQTEAAQRAQRLLHSSHLRPWQLARPLQ